MPQILQVLRERAIGMLTPGMSTRAVARELNVHFSTINRLQRCFREFGSVVDRVAHGGGGVMVWAGVCYEHRCILLMVF